LHGVACRQGGDSVLLASLPVLLR